jgi:hypothetical protein
MKIATLTLALNEEDWIYSSLLSAYNAVDYMLVVEGCLDFNKFNATEDHQSKDCTGLAITNFIDQVDVEHKVIYRKVTDRMFANFGDFRNYCFQWLPDDVDYLLILDGDVLVDKDELNAVRDMVSKYPHIHTIACEQTMFLGSMHRVVKVDHKFHRQTFIHDRFFVKNAPSLRYTDGDAPKYGYELKQLESPEKAPKVPLTITKPSYHWWHFGYVHRKEAMLQKLIRKHILEPRFNGDREKCSEWLQAYHKLFTGVYDEAVGEQLVGYTGQYPILDHLRKHSFWEKSPAWFGL